MGLSLFITNALGADYFYCTFSNQYIYLGDSLESTKTRCGDPASQTTTQILPRQTQSVLEYVYNYRPNTDPRVWIPKALVVHFINDTVFRIWVEGAPVEQCNYCSTTRSFAVGDPRVRVIYACRHPSVIQHVAVPISDIPIEQTVLTYPAGTGMPPVQLYFESNTLVRIE